MAHVQPGHCQSCNVRSQNIVVLDNGEYFCGNCIADRIADGTMLVMRPDGMRCVSCSEVMGGAGHCTDCRDKYAECESCDNIAIVCEDHAQGYASNAECNNCGRDAEICHNCASDEYADGSYCGSGCGNYAEYCESCAEELSAQFECSVCETMFNPEDMVSTCLVCYSAKPEETPTISEGGVMSFDDMEIKWQ